jgi:hypothetical protein
LRCSSSRSGARPRIDRQISINKTNQGRVYRSAINLISGCVFHRRQGAN